MDITLALSGGGIKGIAHIGVIRQLVNNGFQIKAITGSSAGGLVGTLVAAGLSIRKILDMVETLNHHPRLFKRDPKDEPSILGLMGLLDVIKSELSGHTFDQLKIPFACTAVDLISGQEILFHHGDLLEALSCTIAIPGIFPPKKMGNFLLVDGGIIDPVPVEIARWLAPSLPVFAVSLSMIKEDWNPDQPIPPIDGTPIPTPFIEYFSNLRFGQAYKIFNRSLDIIGHHFTKGNLLGSKPDAIIRPDVRNYELIQRVDPDELIRLGEHAVDNCYESLFKAFSIKSRLRRLRKKVSLPENVILI